MWQRLRKDYRDWEEEGLAVLANPEVARTIAPGWRRAMADKMCTLTDGERTQLAAFSRAYRGSTILLPILCLLLVFSGVGFLMQLALAPGLGLFKALLGANLVGFSCVMVWFSAWFNYRRLEGRRLRIFSRIILLAVLGAVFGTVVSVVVHGGAFHAALHELPRNMAIIALSAAIVICAPLLLIGIFRSRQHAVQTAALQRDAEQARLARALSETQLRLLRAQIEPHFLFNTLGAVQQLAEQGAPRAAELTANLIDFLRASLDEMRSDTVTLADEYRLIQAYLRVMQARLGARLHFTLTLPPALEQVRLPGMLLLTLVENAIKHGIEPALRGGAVTVSAAAADGMLRLQVIDTGIGLAGDVVEGTGLANARRRLELAHHGAASLALMTVGAGTLAAINLPLAP
jgi:signal transduction histidine kinase